MEEDYERPLLLNLDVYEDEEEQWSGLYDMHGNPLMYVKEPIGFIHFER